MSIMAWASFTIYDVITQHKLEMFYFLIKLKGNVISDFQNIVDASPQCTVIIDPKAPDDQLKLVSKNAQETFANELPEFISKSNVCSTMSEPKVNYGS